MPQSFEGSGSKVDPFRPENCPTSRSFISIARNRTVTKAIDLGALFADAELPFGHPAGYSDFDDRYEPWPVDPPEENTVHYGPGERSPPKVGWSGAGQSAGPARTAGGPDGNTTQIVPIISQMAARA